MIQIPGLPDALSAALTACGNAILRGSEGGTISDDAFEVARFRLREWAVTNGLDLDDIEIAVISARMKSWQGVGFVQGPPTKDQRQAAVMLAWIHRERTSYTLVAYPKGD